MASNVKVNLPSGHMAFIQRRIDVNATLNKRQDVASTLMLSCINMERQGCHMLLYFLLSCLRIV